MLDYNFFTSYISIDRASRNRTVAIALIFLTLFLVIGGFFTATELISRSMKKDIDSMQSFLNAPDTVNKLKEVELKRKKLDMLNMYYKALENVASSIEAGDRIKSELVESINKTLPKDVVFKNVALTQQDLQLQGEAESRITVAELEHNLNSLGLFSEVYVVSIDRTGEDTKFTFNIQCTLGGVIKK